MASQNNKVPTNAFKVAQAIKPKAQDEQGEISQILYYDPGIGAVPSGGGTQSLLKNIGDAIEKLGGGAFGWWIDEKIESAYIFLCLNYEPGDEIYLFGFSRGAYTVRSLAGLISCSGLLKRPDINQASEAYRIYRIGDRDRRRNEAREFRQINDVYRSLKIKFMGCWDTVGALGIPNFTPLLLVDELFNVKYQFHDNALSSIIENARHAIAIDEKTPGFDVTIMQPGEYFAGTIVQMWFPGTHGCVGGGTAGTLGLSNAALKWMSDEASQLGLNLDLSLAEDTEKIDFRTSFKSDFVLNPLGIRDRDIVELNTELPTEFKFDPDNNFHHSVKQRWRSPDMNYRPKNLKEFVEYKPYNWC